MDSKRKHPFGVRCRYCGSNHVEIFAFDYDELEIRCCNCEKTLTCGMYDTFKYDYSDMH